MSTYWGIFLMLKKYFSFLGYDDKTVNLLFSPSTFDEIIGIKLTNSNVVIKNKRDRTSHQTHIAITGDAVEFFYSYAELQDMDTSVVDKREVAISLVNLRALEGIRCPITEDIRMVDGTVTIGKRTQHQVQFSKRRIDDSHCVSDLRNNLYEDDLLFLLKYRSNGKILMVGMPKAFYNEYCPDFSLEYGAALYYKI